MSQGMERLAKRLTNSKVAGEPVTYTRASDGASFTINAVFGRRQPSRAAVQAGTVILEKEPMDFVFLASDLLAKGISVVERGDRIAIGDGTETYEVTPREGEPEQRRSDAFGHAVRVRTVRQS